MEPKTDNHSGQTPEIIGAEAFAHAYLDLSKGDGEIHGLIDWGYALWPTQGKRDAGEVAVEEFAETAPVTIWLSPRVHLFCGTDAEFFAELAIKNS